MGPGVINFDTPPPAFDSISSSSGSELGERGLDVFRSFRSLSELEASTS